MEQLEDLDSPDRVQAVLALAEMATEATGLRAKLDQLQDAPTARYATLCALRSETISCSKGGFRGSGDA